MSTIDNKFSFTKEWTDSDDFPTKEYSEPQVRADIQLLFDELKDYINNIIVYNINDLASSIAALGGGGEVTTDSLADECVTSEKIKDGEITELKYADDSIPNRALQEACVETINLADDSVTTPKIEDGSVTLAKMANNSVDTVQILDNAVTTPKIANGNVTADKLGTDSVTTAKIANGNVTESKIGTGAVTTTKIADLNVTTGKLANGAVTTAKIADSNVTTGKLANGAVTAAKIEDGSVTSAKLDHTTTDTYVNGLIDAKVPAIAPFKLKRQFSIIQNINVSAGSGSLFIQPSQVGLTSITPTNVIVQCFDTTTGESGEITSFATRIASDGNLWVAFSHTYEAHTTARVVVVVYVVEAN